MPTGPGGGRARRTTMSRGRDKGRYGQGGGEAIGGMAKEKEGQGKKEQRIGRRDEGRGDGMARKTLNTNNNHFSGTPLSVPVYKHVM